MGLALKGLDEPCMSTESRGHTKKNPKKRKILSTVAPRVARLARSILRQFRFLTFRGFGPGERKKGVYLGLMILCVILQ